MQLLIPHIKNSFKTEITRISLTCVPAWSPSWNLFLTSSAPEAVNCSRWELTWVSITPCRSFSCVWPEGAWLEHHLHWLQSTQDIAMALLLQYVWFKTSQVLNLVLCLLVTCSFGKLTSRLSSCHAKCLQIVSGTSVAEVDVCFCHKQHLDFLQVTVTPLAVNRI